MGARGHDERRCRFGNGRECPGAGAAGPWLVELDARGRELGGSASRRTGRDRAPASTPTFADDPAISHRHCALSAGVDRLEVEDLGSATAPTSARCGSRGTSFVGDGGALVLGRSSVVVRDGSPSHRPWPIPPGLNKAARQQRARPPRSGASARTRAPILIQGESGTGKDVVARAVYQLSRRTGNYVPHKPAGAARVARGRGVGRAPARRLHGRRAEPRRRVRGRARRHALPRRDRGSRHPRSRSSCSASSRTARSVRSGRRARCWSTCGSSRRAGPSSSSASPRSAFAPTSFTAWRRSWCACRRSGSEERHSRALPVLLARIRPDVGDKRLTSAALSRLLCTPGLETCASCRARSTGRRWPRAAKRSVRSSFRCRRLRPCRVRLGSARDARRLLDEHQKNVSAAPRAAGVPRSTFRSSLARSESELPATKGPRSPGDTYGTSRA